MTTFVIGGAGFIGRRVIPLLAERGEDVVCMDINPGQASFDALGDKVSVVRGDVTQFDDVMGNMASVKPDRVINLSYHISSDLPPHSALKLNVVGMDNCFEAARLCGVKHTVFASSLAVSGPQSKFGERQVNEDDPCYGTLQYAMNKIFNEFQARDYREKYGMCITAVRPANVTGPDKIFGSVDHVNCMSQPALGKPVSFPYRDIMRIPIHVHDMAEIFARVLMSDSPKHSVYNSGGYSMSMGELADIVCSYLPNAQITFKHDTGGREKSSNFLIDNSRLVEEFGVQLPSFKNRVLETINDVRAANGLPAVNGE
ncbi:MAG: nucleoside-diphosphate-sugar epimerase [Gammaproteobacteria bacterium]|jgi:nucleoside-diphosphate-sugar epimerase